MRAVSTMKEATQIQKQIGAHSGALEELEEVDGVLVREIDVEVEAELGEEVKLLRGHVGFDLIVKLGSHNEGLEALVEAAAHHSVEHEHHIAGATVLLLGLGGKEYTCHRSAQAVGAMQAALAGEPLQQHKRHRDA